MDSPLANINPDSIIDQIAAGAFQSHIAISLGVSPQALHQKLSKHPAYREALKLRNMAKLDNAQGKIDQAAAAIDLARAREAFRAAAWRAERECPSEWGSQVALTGADGGPVRIESISVSFVQASNGHVIDQQPSDFVKQSVKQIEK